MHLTGCGKDYHVRLNNDYTLVRCNNDNIAIYYDGEENFNNTSRKVFIRETIQPLSFGMIVPPKVSNYRISGGIVYGFVDHIKSNEKLLGIGTSSPRYTDNFSGYFILDTENHVCILGLSKLEWYKKLDEYGVLVHECPCPAIVRSPENDATSPEVASETQDDPDETDANNE